MPGYSTYPIPLDSNTAANVLINNFINLYTLILKGLINFLVALVIFLVGWVIALFVKFVIDKILSGFSLKSILEKLGLSRYFENFNWEDGFHKVVSEVVFWLIFSVFLVTVFDVLGLKAASQFVMNALNYVPLAVSGALILLVGVILGEIARKLLLGVLRGLEKRNAHFVASLVKWAIVVFALLAALNQWNIAPEFINDLTIGFFIFLALAGGLSFGLGGQELARDILENMRRELGK